jgi:signal transduction histidine kinase
MQLFLLLVLPLTLIGLLVIFISLNLHESAMRSLVGERDQLAIRAAANALEEQVAHRATTLQSLAVRVVEAQDFDKLLASSSFIYDDFDVGLAVLSRDGAILASNNSFDWDQILDAFRSSLLSYGSTSPQFLPAFYDEATQGYVVLALASAGQQSPIVVGMFSLSFARQTLDTFSSGHSAYFLFGESGEKILEPVNSSAEGYSSYSQLALAGETGSLFTDSKGQEVVLAYAPVDPPGWALIIEEPWESISSPLLRSTQAAPLLLVPVVLFALLALWFEARQIVQPLKKLEAKAAELSWGNYDAIRDSVGGIEEVKRLQAELVHLSEKVQKAQTGLRNYIGAITEGQEEERRRLSNELHDATIQSLIALNQRVQLAQLNATEPGMQKNLVEIRSLVDQAIEDLRRVVRALRPVYLEDLGLSAALGVLCREASQTYNLLVDFQLSGKEKRLAAYVELAFYRIAQEGLSNVGRHAKAKHAWLALDFGTHEVSLSLRDDGRGFQVPESPAEFAPGGHFGLLGIHEKAERMGAKFEIHSEPNKVTQLKISKVL